MWPLFDLVHHDASVWPRAGLRIGHFCPMRELRRRWLAVGVAETEPADAIGVERTRLALMRIKGGENIIKQGQSFNLSSALPHFSWFIEFCRSESDLALLLRSPYNHAFLFHFFVFFNAILFCFLTTAGDSGCLQVSGSAGRWSRVRNELTPGYSEEHLNGLRTHTAAPPTRMFAHYPAPPIGSPLSGCRLTLGCFTLALLEGLGEVRG